MPELTFYTGVGGTHDWQRGEWWKCSSPFAAWMEAQGFKCARRDGPFWSGGLGGLPILKQRSWQFGAHILTDWMRGSFIDWKHRNIISVSHGGQVAMIAAAHGLKLNSLTCITMPQRADMEDTYRKALPNIGTFTNVVSDSWWRDRWQLAGCFLDGSLRVRRRMTLDGLSIVNIGIPGVGHTDLVRTEQMVLLQDYGVLDRIRQA